MPRGPWLPALLPMLAALCWGHISKPAALNDQSQVSRQDAIVESHDGDDYTRYELLAPESAQFRIVYEVTATRPGTRFYFNVIRKGSEASDEAVFDQGTGQALPFKVVTGGEARENGEARADLESSYIQVTLPRPVPNGGELRLRIHKTYKDAKSYYREGDTIVFARGLGIRRNAVVLPAGYEILSCNVPSQVLSEQDGRLAVSFFHVGAGEAPLVLKARPLPRARAGTAAAPPAERRASQAPAPAGAAAQAAAAAAPSLASRLSERAHQDREIVYFLQQPDTHAFALYHDYTESRPGIGAYYNVVREGSRVSNPSARLLDTGEALKVEMVKGAALKAAKVDPGEPVGPETEVVAIGFPPVQKGQSVRLRILETYTDESRYYMDGDELVWDRVLGRPRNAVVLPAGWYVTASSIPAVVNTIEGGRVRLDFDNPRPDEVAVLLKARKR